MRKNKRKKEKTITDNIVDEVVTENVIDDEEKEDSDDIEALETDDESHISEEMYERDMDFDDIEDDEEEDYSYEEEDYSDDDTESIEENLGEDADLDAEDDDESYDEYEEDDFLEEDPYVIKLDKKKKSPKKKAKSDEKTIKGLALLFAWLVFILLVVVFYFYFMDKLPIFGKKDKTTTEESASEITYEINANEDVNKLISDYYDAMETCNQATLQSLVVDPTVFDDMTFYIEKQKVMTEYKNITVYTLPGYFTGDYVAYVTYDLVIANVNSTLADIQCYYISNTSDGFKINNSSLDPELVAHMNDQLNQPDIQALYGSVKAKIDECLENDPTFKAFYDEMTGQTTEE